MNLIAQRIIILTKQFKIVIERGIFEAYAREVAYCVDTRYDRLLCSVQQIFPGVAIREARAPGGDDPLPDSLSFIKLLHVLQILRSSSEWSVGISTTESSIYNAYLDLILNAKHYIYIEVCHCYD